MEAEKGDGNAGKRATGLLAAPMLSAPGTAVDKVC